MTSFAPTSRCAIRPSGETFDRVKPGMSRVVGRLRDDGVCVPDSAGRAGLNALSATYQARPGWNDKSESKVATRDVEL